jgi:hypothetical protein
MKNYIALVGLPLILCVLSLPQAASAQLVGSYAYKAEGLGGAVSQNLVPSGIPNVPDSLPFESDRTAPPGQRLVTAVPIFQFSAAGVLVFDGAGKVAVTDTVKANGIVTRFETYTGTYILYSNGTGSLSMHSGVARVPINYDFVIVNNGTRILLICTDERTAITGTATKQ